MNYNFQGFGVVNPTGTSNVSLMNLPFVPLGMVRFKASPANSTNVMYLGITGAAIWPMSASEDTDWIPAANLANFCVRGVTGTSLFYWYLPSA